VASTVASEHAIEDDVEAGTEALVDRRPYERRHGTSEDLASDENVRRRCRSADLLDDEPEREGEVRDVGRDGLANGQAGFLEEKDRPFDKLHLHEAVKGARQGVTK
jgi:hypothetical protein